MSCHREPKESGMSGNSDVSVATRSSNVGVEGMGVRPPMEPLLCVALGTFNVLRKSVEASVVKEVVDVVAVVTVEDEGLLRAMGANREAGLALLVSCDNWFCVDLLDVCVDGVCTLPETLLSVSKECGTSGGGPGGSC